jgi:hypothetical protein
MAPEPRNGRMLSEGGQGYQAVLCSVARKGFVPDERGYCPRDMCRRVGGAGTCLCRVEKPPTQKGSPGTGN